MNKIAESNLMHTPLNCTPEQVYKRISALREAEQMPEGMMLENLFPPRPEPTIDANGIGHMHVQGFLGNNLSRIEKQLGATDYEDIVSEVSDLLQGARAVIMNINSGGGEAQGNTETAKVFAGIENLHTWSQGVMCSAAYNIGVMGNQIGIWDSSQVGSIGTILPFIDESGLWKMMGLEFDPITNEEGDLKGAGHGPSLTDQQRRSIQRNVQKLFDLFKNNVTGQREIEDKTMRGQSFIGTDALDANLVDFVGSWANFYSAILTTVTTNQE